MRALYHFSFYAKEKVVCWRLFSRSEGQRPHSPREIRLNPKDMRFLNLERFLLLFKEEED